MSNHAPNFCHCLLVNLNITSVFSPGLSHITDRRKKKAHFFLVMMIGAFLPTGVSCPAFVDNGGWKSCTALVRNSCSWKKCSDEWWLLTYSCNDLHAVNKRPVTWWNCIQVHYPIEALQNVPFADSKARLLELQVSRFTELVHSFSFPFFRQSDLARFMLRLYV